MEPQSISEKLMLSIILINTARGRGTGFFYHFIYDTTPVMVNLGYYIKVKELLEFKNFIGKIINIKNLVNNSKTKIQDDNKYTVNV